MELFGTWLLIAGLTEAVVEILKTFIPDYIKDKITYVVSIVVGIMLAYAFQVNPFELTGLAAHVSIVLAGVLASRGANYLHNVLKKLGIA